MIGEWTHYHLYATSDKLSMLFQLLCFQITLTKPTPKHDHETQALREFSPHRASLVLKEDEPKIGADTSWLDGNVPVVKRNTSALTEHSTVLTGNTPTLGQNCPVLNINRPPAGSEHLPVLSGSTPVQWNPVYEMCVVRPTKCVFDTARVTPHDVTSFSPIDREIS